jgi:hypothetical protein
MTRAPDRPPSLRASASSAIRGDGTPSHEQDEVKKYIYV